MSREPNIETTAGRYAHLTSPTPSEIHLDDVACALSHICRFGGFVDRHYSVAEHALYVSELVEWRTGSTDLAFAALHHDSHEAYLGDIPTPLKPLLGDALPRLAGRFDAAIGARWGIDPEHFHHRAVKAADEHAMRIEARELKHSRGVGPHWGFVSAPIGEERRRFGMPDYLAEAAFKVRHRELLRAGL